MNQDSQELLVDHIPLSLIRQSLQLNLTLVSFFCVKIVKKTERIPSQSNDNAGYMTVRPASKHIISKLTNVLCSTAKKTTGMEEWLFIRVISNFLSHKHLH